METKDPTPSLPVALPEASPLAPLSGGVARELGELKRARSETPQLPAERVAFDPKAGARFPTVGRIVLFRLPPKYPGRPGDAESDPPIEPTPASVELRPALVVNAWPGSVCANLRVFLDPDNDLEDGGVRLMKASQASRDKNYRLVGNDLLVLSADEGSGPGCWSWPPRA